jgi:hypothetical protein
MPKDYQLCAEEDGKQIVVDSYDTIEEALEARTQLRKWCKEFKEVTRVYVKRDDDREKSESWGFAYGASSTDKNKW